MPIAKPEVELARLKKEQEKARQSAIFLGLSVFERHEYDGRAKRIRELQSSIPAVADIGDEKQQKAWAQTTETDTPQEDARQPYRDREENSSQAYTDSKADSREVKRKKVDTE